MAEMSTRPSLPSVLHAVATIVAILGVGIHVRTDHGEPLVDDVAELAEAVAPIVETQPGRDLTALRPSPALIHQLTAEEGFRGDPYEDSLGHPTIGIGTKLPITRAEAQWLLGERLATCLRELAHLRPVATLLPRPVLDVVANACYANGPEGLAGYHRFWVALEARDWRTAAHELRDSKWGREEAPQRVERLAKQLERIGD